MVGVPHRLSALHDNLSVLPYAVGILRDLCEIPLPCAQLRGEALCALQGGIAFGGILPPGEQQLHKGPCLLLVL